MNPSISIITVNLNNAAGLETTIKSVVRQTTNDFEFIIVDGDSNDGSKELLHRYSKNIAVAVSEKDSGIYDAMNKGILRSRGEYLLFLNSGDELYEADTLRNILPFLEAKSDIVYGNLMIDDNGQRSIGIMPPTIDLKQMMTDTLWHPVSFIRAELFRKFGLYDTSFKICGDYEFFFKTIISKNVSTIHSGVVVAVFGLKGISSDIKNVPIIQAEKKRVQETYLSADQIELFHQQNRKRPSLISKFIKWFR